MTQPLHRTRCVVHPHREAAGKCTQCERFFCRECVTEHDGKLRCAHCLAQSAAEAPLRSSRWGAIKAGLQMIAGSFALWLFFLAAAELLAGLPRAGADEDPAATEQIDVETAS